MIVTFDKVYLRDLYEYSKTSDKSHRFQPSVVARYIRCIDILLAEKTPAGLYKYRSLNYEKLVGDKEGLYSVRVNDKYRIEFSQDVNSDMLTICNIVELSNHYK